MGLVVGGAAGGSRAENRWPGGVGRVQDGGVTKLKRYPAVSVAVADRAVRQQTGAESMSGRRQRS
ncbi:hypothetical protein GCM10010109_11950 [Actinoplanes campanulatus]|nr:hypothetical protein GCM10010109_11950 [Actinoplanes campanulatus]GID35249.1 hypothetical protein Aca09nite_17550 [Actinoplanes campanulatus]